VSRRRSDDGSAVVDFVLVSTLVVLVVLALVQLSFALLVRNTLVAAASEGARFGAFQGSTPDAAAAHTRRLLAMTLPDDYADGVTAGYEEVDGVSTVVVRVRAALPLIAWWGPGQVLTAQGHAVVEQP
jgi:hypothetical protein